MMKKLLFSFVLLVSTLTASAEWANVGYNTTDAITSSGGAFGQAGTYTLGALFSPDQLDAYRGCPIVGMRIAAAMNLGSSRTFIYSIGDNQMDIIKEQNQRLKEGWTQILFNGDPYVITGEETLFFGFDYVETADMVTADQGGLCGVGTDTDGAFMLFMNGALYSISNLGQLCVQLIVDVTSLPTYDLDLSFFDAGFRYKQAGEAIDGLVSFRNVGKQPLNSYQLGYQLDDNTPVLKTFDLTEAEDETKRSLAVGATESWTFNFSLPADITVGKHSLRVFIDQVQGEAMAANSRHDERTFDFVIYENSVSRHKTLLEIYTDQSSYYVPYLDDIVKRLKADAQLEVVNVPRPNTSLAVDASAYLHELYAYTWPTFTSNRSYFPGENHIAYDMNDYYVAGTDMCTSIMQGIVMQDIDDPSFGTIQLERTYNADTRQLTIQASGDLLADAAAIYGDVALTLMVVEDGLVAPQTVVNTRTSSLTVNQNYVHDDVLRGYMTAATGDKLEPVDGHYTLERTLTLDAGWNADRLRIVALLTKYADAVTADNIYEMDVFNCNSIRVTDATGVGATLNDKGQMRNDKDIYDLQGRRVTKPTKGLYIVNGKKRLVK